VNQAYKDLAFIWHPDRIPKDNLRLQQKAQEKLKEINQARDQLRSILPSGQNQNQPQPSPKTLLAALSRKAIAIVPAITLQSHQQARKHYSDLLTLRARN